MKLMKAMKRLKFWPRMKKRKKYHFLPPSSPPPPSRPPPPPPQYYHHYEPLLPSAPPLPPWLEYDMQFEETPQISSPGANIIWSPTPSATMDDEYASSNGSHLVSEEIQVCGQDDNQGNAEGDVVPELRKLQRRDELLGAFGCVVRFGEHLVRCVFPCFHIREKGGGGGGGAIVAANTSTTTYKGLIGQ